MQQIKMQKGFTLIELVIVIIVMSILAVPLMDGFTTSARSISINDEIQTATMLAQECAETILYKTRSGSGYDSNVGTGFNSWCTQPAIAGYATYTRSVTTNTGVAPGNDYCPSTAAECALVQIAITVGGQTRSSIDLLMVD